MDDEEYCPSGKFVYFEKNKIFLNFYFLGFPRKSRNICKNKKIFN